MHDWHDKSAELWAACKVSDQVPVPYKSFISPLMQWHLKLMKEILTSGGKTVENRVIPAGTLA